MFSRVPAHAKAAKATSLFLIILAIMYGILLSPSCFSGHFYRLRGFSIFSNTGFSFCLLAASKASRALR